MPNSKHSLVNLPPVPREGQLALLCAVEDVLGRTTELARRLTRAIASEEPVDLIEAQSAFDSLPDELRQKIAGEVRRLVAEEADDSGAADGANVVYLRPVPRSPR